MNILVKYTVIVRTEAIGGAKSLQTRGIKKLFLGGAVCGKVWYENLKLKILLMHIA